MKIRIFSLIALLGLLLALVACSDDSTTNPILEPNDDRTRINIFTAAKEVAPSFAEITAKTDLDPANPMYYMYNSFRMFDPALHQGIIDGSNFFRALYDMDESLQEIFEVTNEIEPVVIEEPFELGNSETYDHAANRSETEENGNIYSNGYAYRLEGELIHFLVTFQIIENSGAQITLGQLQGSYNMGSSDLDLAMVYMVDYNSGEEYYVVRNEITGNEITHEFELRMVTYGSFECGTSIVGKGKSQGEDAYFLIKMNGDGELVTMGERYYVFPADADEAFLLSVEEDGYQFDNLPAEVTDLQTTVHDLVLFVPEDLPVGHAEFNDSNILLEF